MFKVLIVDDELPIKRSLKKIIETELPDFTVIGTADNGEEALAFMEESQPDLVITDIHMPVINGFELAQEIKNRGLAPEIVIISGYSSTDYFRQALWNCASDYLMKPIDTDEVVATLMRCAAKLIKHKQELLEKSDWYTTSKSFIHRLASHIWLLNRDAMVSELKDLHQLFVDKRYHLIMMHEMYLDVLTLLMAELGELSGSRFHYVEYTNLKALGRHDKLYEQVQATLIDMMENIRGMRNWGTHKTIRNALDNIHQSYMNETLSLRDIALSVGMSPNYFSKCFSEEVGISYSQYINRLRMEKALDLLNDPLFKVYEVAHAIGFSDYTHFAKVFKKKYEFSPTEYRANMGII
ncbi:Helix-turn-helix domain-containing protein [Paenibacillus sp. yr247]|uniref:response regulator n=1 Tax=Paenibacillus sp. yr247 TaxID=1761880 RepID=UPI00089011D6|nr:response regulator [Paenibacillus sp. yr247]SDO37682.1 Helix-turn-helix domain-containing protein [Paenibacillus sp. yr247]